MQGAERKTRDEERRAAKRKMTATGRKKLDELYHPVTDRSEFYSMQDLSKPPVLFSPAEDIDKVSVFERSININNNQITTSNHHIINNCASDRHCLSGSGDGDDASNTETTTTTTSTSLSLTNYRNDHQQISGMELHSFYGHESDLSGTPDGSIKGSSPFLLHATSKPSTPTLKFHNHFPPDVPT